MSELEIYQSFDLPFFKHKGIAANPAKAAKLFKDVNFKGKSVADFGCCEGYYCFKAVIGGASSVTGYDLDQRRLDTAERIKAMMPVRDQKNARFIKADLTDANFIPEKADYTIFCSVSHHIPLLQTIRKVAAATKQTAFVEILVDETLTGPILKYHQGRQWVEEIIPSIECATAMLKTYFKTVIQLPHDNAETDRVFFICHK